jgi:hypothetical protein
MKPQPIHLQLSWFFMDAAAFEARTEAWVDLITSTLPEALPRRYGPFEPPQYRLDREGMPHFKAFLKENLHESIVWYCANRGENCFLAMDDVGPSGRGFRCARITMEVSSKGKLGEWFANVSRFWIAVAEMVNPFYAEMRLDGDCPIKAGWWNGVPHPSAHAVLIGPPYVALWPQFISIAESATRLFCQEPGDRGRDNRAFDHSGSTAFDRTTTRSRDRNRSEHR